MAHKCKYKDDLSYVLLTLLYSLRKLHRKSGIGEREFTKDETMTVIPHLLMHAFFVNQFRDIYLRVEPALKHEFDSLNKFISFFGEGADQPEDLDDLAGVSMQQKGLDFYNTLKDLPHSEKIKLLKNELSEDCDDQHAADCLKLLEFFAQETLKKKSL